MKEAIRHGVIIAIDPGTKETGIVVYAPVSQSVDWMGILPNPELRDMLVGVNQGCIAIEMIASYGMPVGREVFETCVWIGRLIEACSLPPDRCRKVYRRQVKQQVCSSPRAKDGNVRQAIIDRYPRSGGGKTPQIGTKAQPGPLYGMRSHMWAALGVGITASEIWRDLEVFDG